MSARRIGGAAWPAGGLVAALLTTACLSTGCLPIVDNPDNCVLNADACDVDHVCDPILAQCQPLPLNSDYLREEWSIDTISDVPPPASGADQGWQARRRDPAVLRARGRLSVYYAGSPTGSESWTLGSASVPVDGKFESPTYARALQPDPASWDRGPLFGPSLVESTLVPGSAFALYYAASGDPALAPYVSQIGLAQSHDGITWERRAAPILPAPAAEGGRPDSHGLADPSVLVVGPYVWLYYTAISCSGDRCHHQILRAVSTDGESFRPAVVSLFGRDDWKTEDGGVAQPSVVRAGGRFYMAYTAVPATARPDAGALRAALEHGSVAVAVSLDGLRFTSLSRGEVVLPQNDAFGSKDGTFAPALDTDLTLYYVGAPAMRILRTRLVRP